MNALYDKAREDFANALIAWTTSDIRAILVDTGAHTITLNAADPVLADIAAGARIAVSGNLANKTNVGGVCDADDYTFTAVSGATVEAIVLYKHTGVESTSRLIAAIDTAAGLVLTPNGGNVQITWDNGANKIFKL